MDSKLIDGINKQVYRKFPEVNGSKPTVTPRPGDQFLLVYKGKGVTADGHPIDRTVRVVADAVGKISRITTSK